MSLEVLWYIPNQAEPGTAATTWWTTPTSLEKLTAHARALEVHGWDTPYLPEIRRQGEQLLPMLRA